MKFLIAAALLALPLLSTAAEPQWVGIVGHGVDAADTDIVRLGYRFALPEKGWWMPTHAQVGGSVWRVPDLAGTTRRIDVNATAIWRGDWRLGYLEGGIGGYLLSKTINNPDTRIPSAFEFGSHLGAGIHLSKQSSLGVGIQHLSNAGIKQPNGGINLVLLQYTYAVR